jgi:tryptophan-rich sensory protein
VQNTTFLQIRGFAGWLLLTMLAAAVGAMASVNAATFYAQLQRPTWAPPAWLFAPVWTALYLMMAIAAWLVWRAGGLHANRTALGLYVAQLALNSLWSWLFFGWRQGAWAFADIVVLWILIVATLVSFWRVRPLAGGLLVPYLAWVSFAMALNFAAWQMNPGMLG